MDRQILHMYLPIDGEERGTPDGGEVVVGHEVALALAGDCAQVADEAAEGAAVDPGELGEEDAVPVNDRGENTRSDLDISLSNRTHFLSLHDDL